MNPYFQIAGRSPGSMSIGQRSRSSSKPRAERKRDARNVKRNIGAKTFFLVCLSPFAIKALVAIAEVKDMLLKLCNQLSKARQDKILHNCLPPLV